MKRKNTVWYMMVVVVVIFPFVVNTLPYFTEFTRHTSFITGSFHQCHSSYFLIFFCQEELDYVSQLEKICVADSASETSIADR